MTNVNSILSISQWHPSSILLWNYCDYIIMKRKSKQWWSTTPIVSTNQTITSLLNSLNTTKYDITIWKWMSWLGEHNNVVSVKKLMESQPSIYILFLVFAPGLKWRRTDHTNSRFNNTVALMIWLKLWVTYCHGLITKIEFFMIYIYIYIYIRLKIKPNSVRIRF